MPTLQKRTPASINPSATPAAAVVNCWNEWDPLEEVIVGVVDGACFPPWHLSTAATMPSEHHDLFRRSGGQSFPAELVAGAARELDNLARLLEREGIVVRRPQRVDPRRGYATPEWSVISGLYAAMPRDVLLVIGDELIEAPMPWRCRYHEINAYRPLLKEYFHAGARWSATPKPELADALYDDQWTDPAIDGAMRYVLTDYEPVFDAADFIRCGADIFYQLSNVTNQFGVAWLRRQLSPRHRLHELTVKDSHPMHVDATFLPLSPGRVLVNRERLPALPDVLRHWEVLPAPPPCAPSDRVLYMSSRWLSMNLLSLDDKRVLVEKAEHDTIAALRGWGYAPIPIDFKNFNAFGGSFHCATLDIRRRGVLESYL